MAPSGKRSWKTPREGGLGLDRIENRAGLSISVLPNGCIFAIEHRREDGTTMINQLLGSPVDGGIARLYLRIGGAAPIAVAAAGPGAKGRFGAAGGRFVWDGETSGLGHRVTLSLHPRDTAWLWCLEVMNPSESARNIDAVLIQDIGLGDRGFLMNNEAYASQYIDHHIADHPHCGPVVMSRQNLAQAGRNPWVVHGCLEGAGGFATDGMQLFGPAFRDRDGFPFPFGTSLPSKRLQHELACAAIQSFPATLPPGARAAWRFFGLYDQDHPNASSDNDLTRLETVAWDDGESPEFQKLAQDQSPHPEEAAQRPSRGARASREPRCSSFETQDLPAPQDEVEAFERTARLARSLVQDSVSAAAEAIGTDDVVHLYPERWHEERAHGQLLSFFVPDPPHNRHVVLRDKERLVTRRHGTLLRSGQAMLPDEATLCATCWMHGVFAAQLTIGNTSFHKLFSVSRDPYNITRASGLRVLVDTGEGWRLLTVPSAFEMGLSDCRWIYRLGGRMITVRAIASGEDTAMQWRVTVVGEPCKFLFFGHLVLGEREFDCDGLIEIDTQSKRFSLRPGPVSIWRQRYPHAVYHLVTSTPEAVEAIGGDELLYADRQPRHGSYLALRTRPVREFSFAVVGSMTDPEAAERLVAKFEHGVEDASLLRPARRFWGQLTRNLRITGGGGAAFDTLFPWLAHNAMIHLTVPHGLEQYTGAAWGTRDVCQGPVEFLLALEHDDPVKEILRIVFAQQYEASGDWPQWFMLEPYSIIQDKVSHGDVIVWPLKALNDYIEATGDISFLDEKVAWRCADTLAQTARKDTVAEHVDCLLVAVRARFIPGTHLIRYGEGDWNDSLQTVDPKLRDWMVSSWTVALLFQQLNRYAEVLRRAGREAEGVSQLAGEMKADFNRFLLRDGTVAGYAIFDPDGGSHELLLHPSDTRTGLKYSLLPMTRSIIGGLFTARQVEHHLRLIREHLLFPDGVRLIDRPVAYRGGPQTVFRRAESSSFFGREIGLMYVHAHLRYAEAMAILGEAEALWDALMLVNPIAVTDRLAQATPRQRNVYFSSSDAVFPDRYAASNEWWRANTGMVRVEGGWRIYSSGPGIYAKLIVGHVLGHRRRWGRRTARPLLPRALQDVTVELDSGG